MEKKCNVCNETKNVDMFYRKDRNEKYLGSAAGYSSECRACVSVRMKSDRIKSLRSTDRAIGVARNSELKRYYGITLEDFNDLMEIQGGQCEICGGDNSQRKNQKALCVDHDHETKRVRGLLCSKCNHALGLFNDNPDLLRSAATYLESALPELDLT